MLTRVSPPDWLEPAARRRLHARLEAGLRAARRRGGQAVLLSATQLLPGSVDPSAIVLASRRRDEPWFCLEQPERDGFALGALGGVHELTASGERRFQAVGAAWRTLAARALADDPPGPDGAGLVAVGGFAFAADGGASSRWNGFSPASLLVPEVSLCRRAGRSWLTVNVLPAADDTVDDLQRRVDRRLGELRADVPLPLLDPAPTGEFRVSSPMPASHYEAAVAGAVQRIRSGELEKVVLAREVEVEAPRPHDPGAVLAVLRDGFPACFVYAVGRGEASFVGASPELLIRRQGQRASTVALAGSTRRSADPSVDDHLGERLLHSDKDRHENAIVARRIARQLAPHSVWVTAAPEPSLVKVANIQHLGAAIRAQLAAPVGAVELAGILHPTPAVGAEPAALAEHLIPALEGLDRGWYAGPVGYTDSTEDGEFCVALRCALLRGRTATCYAGCGIVADSDPAAELAETVTKFRTMRFALEA